MIIFDTTPRKLIMEAVCVRASALVPMVSAWLCQRTTHLYFGEGSKGSPIHATSGVDQGCPLSPALFVIGLAASLERMQDKLAALSPDCRVFSYLDDVMVVIPSEQACCAGASHRQAVVFGGYRPMARSLG